MRADTSSKSLAVSERLTVPVENLRKSLKLAQEARKRGRVGWKAESPLRLLPPAALPRNLPKGAGP